MYCISVWDCVCILCTLHHRVHVYFMLLSMFLSRLQNNSWTNVYASARGTNSSEPIGEYGGRVFSAVYNCICKRSPRVPISLGTKSSFELFEAHSLTHMVAVLHYSLKSDAHSLSNQLSRAQHFREESLRSHTIWSSGRVREHELKRMPITQLTCQKKF